MSPFCESCSWRNPQGADPSLVLASTGLSGQGLLKKMSTGPLNTGEQYPALKALPSLLALEIGARGLPYLMSYIN